MYSPPYFQIEDRETLHAFMRRHSFATIITHDGAAPHATHMPVVLEDAQGPLGTLVSHMARANPQWRHFENGHEVLVIFTGPHAYISPAWYATQPAVPTWNYTTVHAYGRARLISDSERFATMLGDLIEFYEAPRGELRWDGYLPTEFRDKMMAAIVGVEIEITRLEGKFKLSQNRPPFDVSGIIQALATSEDQTEREVAAMMKALLNQTS